MEAVYRFSFDVNPSDVLQLDALLGDCILHDPIKAVSLFQSVSLTGKNLTKHPTKLSHSCLFKMALECIFSANRSFLLEKCVKTLSSCFIILNTTHLYLRLETISNNWECRRYFSGLLSVHKDPVTYWPHRNRKPGKMDLLRISLIFLITVYIRG